MRSPVTLFRLTALLILLAASIIRLVSFHRAALYPIPFPLVIGHDLLLIAPYLFSALMAVFVSHVPLLILAVLIAGTGLNLDYHHFAHLSKDSAFDGVSYIGHTALSVAGTVVAIIFFGSKRRS